MSNPQDDLSHARQLTAANLARMLQNNTEELTRMHLDDVTELADEVARVLPAGNVVTMVFSQLSTIKGKQVSGNETRQMMGLLKQGMSTFLDKATYLTFYTTPAILISGYQQLLELAGKDPNSAFPNGTWQYYLEFGLREDAGRHACETKGFDWIIEEEGLRADETDRLASWIMAASWMIARYDHLIIQEWREQIILQKLAEQTNMPRINKEWVARRPYYVPPHINVNYLSYRYSIFNAFVVDVLSQRLRTRRAEKMLENWYEEETQMHSDMHSFRNQMTIMSMLEPDEFSDERVLLTPDELNIAIYYNGQYHVIPAMHNGQLLDITTIRTFTQSILNTKTQRNRMALDEILVQVPRASQKNVRRQIPKNMKSDVEQLRRAPIVINWDQIESDFSLSSIRHGRRGLGDHALTLFQTTDSMVFDQSHIYFDATWGMAIAEIVTNQAIKFLRQMQSEDPVTAPSLKPLSMNLVPPKNTSKSMQRSIARSYECSAEIEVKFMDMFQEVRRGLQQRHSDLRLTINDILVLYRSMYNQHYKPAADLVKALEIIVAEGSRWQSKAAETAMIKISEMKEQFPAFLIPIDATALDPKERIFPVTYRPQPPWTEMDIQHQLVWETLVAYEDALDRRQKRELWRSLNNERTEYLEMLRMFGVLMLRYKEVALAGQSLSTRTLKILASVPKKLQTWLRHIPDRIDLLNDMLKGTEVFSNVGRVADDSSLTRFITAKDDNEKKALCWGIMTRADDTMVITLRDFRPWVMDLHASGESDVAQMITYDYLHGYAEGLYQFMKQLSHIVRVTGK